MNRRYMAFIALALTMLFGAGFVVFDPTPRWYPVVGAVLVALGWISVGVFGKDEPLPEEVVRPPSTPYGDPPEDAR